MHDHPAQIQGCGEDLTGSKPYFQRYRVCPKHLKASTVLRNGTEQRFCQQCGRFHPVGDFDGSKRYGLVFEDTPRHTIDSCVHTSTHNTHTVIAVCAWLHTTHVVVVAKTPQISPRQGYHHHTHLYLS